MRKVGLVVGLTLAAIACATGADMVSEMMDSGVPDAGAQPGVDGKFVGYTEEAYSLSPRQDPDTGSDEYVEGGLFFTYAACQSDFGSSARICTVAEVLTTVSLPSPPPEREGDVAESGAWLVEDLDVVPSCWGGSGSGLYLSPTGVVDGSSSCSYRRRIACCTTN